MPTSRFTALYDDHSGQDIEKDAPSNGRSTSDVQTSAGTSLQRGLKERHITMIAMGGSIGTGLVIGTGKSLAQAPGSLFVSYTFLGLIVFLVMAAMGLMPAWIPFSAGFTGYVSRYCDPSLGFALGWTYMMKYLIMTPNQLTAGALVLQCWVPREKLNTGAWVAIFLVLIIIINFWGIRFFGEFEFWLSKFKVVIILGTIIFCLVLVVGGGPNHDCVGFDIGKTQGPSKSTLPPAASGASLVSGRQMINATFAYMGTELFGVTVAEAQTPRKTIPKAIKLTFFRILLFYCISVLLMGMLCFASPFVVAAELAAVPAVPHILNGCLLVFIFSACNTDLYTASRTLYGLSAANNAPRLFTRTIWNAILRDYGAGAWCKARMAQGVKRDALPYASPFWIWGSYFALLICILILLTKNFDVFVGWEAEPFEFATRSVGVRPEAVDLFTDKEVFDREEEHFREQEQVKEKSPIMRWLHATVGAIF
ncbi:amino acid permease-domain-containing protein [Aspergillus pseudocaelatus]|uniref:Amino acid permease-domain-containing protein n=1 Tax=Aspergillus pseudocaelatus TaxID=1825620 RepID=A0ABQ6W6C1_9EURO|nr:amino acid permease-domain-containing protein [Aspergillus pseudocaelatus]